MTLKSACVRLTELAERCEAATGPNYQLEIEINRAVKGFPPSWPDTYPGALVSNYTASLDAAMTLVPEGMQWFKERGAYVPNIAVIQGPICSFVGETDSSFALALCAAALRAIAETSK